MSIIYDLVAESELQVAHAIERAGYPEDEAATLQTFQYRQAQAPDLFLGAYVPSGPNRTIVGYICSTLSPDPSLTHSSMSIHVPSSSSVCVHSVCVSLDHRRKGIALGLLKEYIARLERARQQAEAPYERILLIAHEELTGLYEKAGFELVGKSAVVHGARPWFEMRRVLSVSIPPPELQPVSTQGLPPGLWEALQQSSSRARPTGRPLSLFPNGIQDVIERTAGSGVQSNKYDLLCPREGCGSIILKKSVATLVERESIQLEPSAQQNPHLVPLPTPSTLMYWWRVTPNVMAFENIGFSRQVGTQLPNGKKLKLLLCAECDLGPLGWCEEGGSEFWLASSRVSYRYLHQA